MIERCQIRKFALVNVHHSESSFEKLCEFVETSLRLRDLNVSWQSLRPAVFVKLLQVIKDDLMLQNLNISHNKILEDQPKSLTEAQIERGLEEVPLSDVNKETLMCLTHFIKYNTFLVHLDLRNIGLIVPAIKFIASYLNKAQALQCLHLGGNEGVTPSTVNWVCERIKGKMKETEISIPPMSKEFQYKNYIHENHGPINHGLLKLLRSQTSIENDPREVNQMVWKDIRQGLKLRNIV